MHKEDQLAKAASKFLPDVDSGRPGAALRGIGLRLMSLADQLDDRSTFDEEPLNLAICERNQLLMVVWAEAEYNGRRQRAKYVPGELLGEPAWDILLDLFIQEARHKRVSVTSACKAADVPDSTALRWLNVLEEADMIRRFPANHDKRVQFIELTDAGTLAVSNWLRYRAALPVY